MPIKDVQRTIFAYGGQINSSFIKYVIFLTNKSNPKICFLPTAMGDHDSYIDFWYSLTKNLSVKSYIQKIDNKPSCEDFLLGMDAIMIGGGNTYNMLNTWKVYGMDIVLKKAYNKGIIMAGGSAGSMCWFVNGYTDSISPQLTKLDCLGYIKASHCPHYDTEKTRRPLYQKGILKGEILPGYACDDLSGVLFRNEQYVKSVSINKESRSYFISVVNGKIEEKILEQELIQE